MSEGIGRWSIPRFSVYGIWPLTGKVPDVAILGALVTSMVLLDTLNRIFDSKPRTPHDR